MDARWKLHCGFARHPQLEVVLFHKDGGSGAQLISKPDNLKVVEPAFGLMVDIFYYSQRFSAWNYNAQLPQYRLGFMIVIMARDVITTRYGSAFTPTFHPMASGWCMARVTMTKPV